MHESIPVPRLAGRTLVATDLLEQGMEISNSNSEKDVRIANPQTIEVVQENLAIDVVKHVTGEVIIDQSVDAQTVDIPLDTLHTTYVEKRVPFGTVVTEAPQIRTEGDTTIIPVFREEEVVVKRLVLVEEIHLTRQQQKTIRTEPVTLRSTAVRIQRK